MQPGKTLSVDQIVTVLAASLSGLVAETRLALPLADEILAEFTAALSREVDGS